MVVVVLPPPSPEPVSKRACSVRVRSLGKLVAFHFNVLSTLVPFGKSWVSSVEYSIQTDSLPIFPRLKLNPVIWPAAFFVNTAFLVISSVGFNLYNSSTFKILLGWVG